MFFSKKSKIIKYIKHQTLLIIVNILDRYNDGIKVLNKYIMYAIKICTRTTYLIIALLNAK